MGNGKDAEHCAAAGVDVDVDVDVAVAVDVAVDADGEAPCCELVPAGLCL